MYLKKDHQLVLRYLPLLHRFENSFYEVSDIFEEVRNYSRSLVFDPERLSEIQERLALIYKLKKKYASSPAAPLNEVIQYAENAAKTLEELSGAGADSSKLQAETEALEKQVYIKAKQLSQKRKAAAEKMSAGVMTVLENLGMKGTGLQLEFQKKTELTFLKNVILMEWITLNSL